MKESNFYMVKQPVIKKMEFLGNSNFIAKDNSLNVKIDIKIKKESSMIDKKAQVSLTINLNEKYNLEEVPFILKAEILGQFIWKEEATREEIEIFLNSTAPSIMLSYIRPIISNVVTYSGFPAFIIPFLDLRAE